MTRNYKDSVTMTISNGQTVSDAYVNAHSVCMLGAAVGSAFDGTSMGFQVSADGSTYQDLYDYTGTIVSMTMGASKSYDLPGALAVWRFWKFKAATSQTGDTTIAVVAKG